MNQEPRSQTWNDELRQTIWPQLERILRSAQRLVVVEGVAWVMGCLFAGAAVQIALEYSTHGLRFSMRAAILGAILVAAGWAAVRRVVGPMRKQFDVIDAAHLMERRFPQFGASLLTAIRFADVEIDAERISPDLIALAARQAQELSKGVEFQTVLNPKRARRAGAAIAAMVALSVAAVGLFPNVAGLWFRRNVLLASDAWPRRTTLIVETESDPIIAAQGDDVVIQARAEGVQPREVELLYESSSGQRVRQNMVTVGAEGSTRYRFVFQRAQENFQFQLRGGDDQTRSFTVVLLERPRVVRTTMTIEPPRYTGLGVQEFGESQRAAEFLPGSFITLRAELNHEVIGATLKAHDATVATALPSDSDSGPSDRVQIRFQTNETHTFHFELVDSAGLTNKEVVRFSLQRIKDEAPRVRLRLPGVGEMVTPEAVLPVETEFEDLYGLSRAELGWTSSREGSETQRVTPESFESGMKIFRSEFSWPASKQGVSPGERLTMFVEAADHDDVSGPNVARSPDHTLRVVTREELSTELARREESLRADFERAVDAQEQLRGKLLTLYDRFQKEATFSDFTAIAAEMERSQRNLTSSVNVIRQQFERILQEVRVNQLDVESAEERIGGKILAPLNELTRKDMVFAADSIRRWSIAPAPEAADRIDPQQVTLLAMMRDVLSNMIHQAGYQEVVNMLRDIIRLQEDLNKESRRNLEEQADKLFDD